MVELQWAEFQDCCKEQQLMVDGWVMCFMTGWMVGDSGLKLPGGDVSVRAGSGVSGDGWPGCFGSVGRAANGRVGCLREEVEGLRYRLATAERLGASELVEKKS